MNRKYIRGETAGSAFIIHLQERLLVLAISFPNFRYYPTDVMSLSRQFFRELRPLFHMLEEPLVRSSFTGPASLTPFARSRGSPFAVFNDPFFQNSLSSNVPAVDVTEEPGAFVVEAELPGVKKENVDLRIGDGGQSLTIEGRTFFQSTPPEAASAAEGQQAQQATSGQPEITDSSSAPVNGK